MRDLNHPRFLQRRLYRSRRADRVGRLLYFFLVGSLAVALLVGFKTLSQS
jgi:hypothetical protein